MNCHRRLSAWESGPSRAFTCPELRSWLSASDREIPVFTGVNGTLMARRSWTAPCLMALRPSAFQAGHISSWRGSYESYAPWPVAAVSGWLLLLLSPLLSAAGLGPHLRGLPGHAADHPSYGPPKKPPKYSPSAVRADCNASCERIRSRTAIGSASQLSLSRAKATCRPIVPLSKGKRKCPYGFLPCIAQRRWHLAPGAAGR